MNEKKGKKKKDNECYRVLPSTLNGKVKISGAKNSVLYLQTASLLTDETVIIENYPDELLDAKIHTEMLNELGKKCIVTENRIEIKKRNKKDNRVIWPDRSIRNTLLILGALLARNFEGSVPLPGGCKLGERKYDIHQYLLKELGANIWEEKNMLCGTADRGLKGAEIKLPLKSTGATNNAIICGCLAKGVTRVWNPHIRPETIDLINFLRTMGAKIKVFGQEHIEIVGKEYLLGTTYNVLPDNMEAISWLIGAVVTGGDIEIENFPWRDLEVPLIYLRESGAKFFKGEESMIVRGGKCYPIEISTGPFPGINSDMQPLFAIFGACAKGQSKIIDLRFPGRYAYADEFSKLGISCELQGNMLKINGGKPFKGAEVTAVDLRAGIALVLAGLVANGETYIKNAWQIERGYNQFIRKINNLGGKVFCE